MIIELILKNIQNMDFEKFVKLEFFVQNYKIIIELMFKEIFKYKLWQIPLPTFYQ